MAKQAKDPAAPKKPRGRPRKDRPAYLPTMEPPDIPEINEAAYAYVELRDQRQAVLKEEIDARLALETLLFKHGLAIYEFDGYMIELVKGDVKARVRRKPAAKGEEEDDADL